MYKYTYTYTHVRQEWKFLFMFSVWFRNQFQNVFSLCWYWEHSAYKSIHICTYISAWMSRGFLRLLEHCILSYCILGVKSDKFSHNTACSTWILQWLTMCSSNIFIGICRVFYALTLFLSLLRYVNRFVSLSLSSSLSISLFLSLSVSLFCPFFFFLHMIVTHAYTTSEWVNE